MPKLMETSSQRNEQSAENRPTNEDIEVRAHEIYIERRGTWTGCGWIGRKQHGTHLRTQNLNRSSTDPT